MKPIVPFRVFLDAGHGGLVFGRYVTKGKRSPKDNDGYTLYEGVYNREIVDIVRKKLHDNDILAESFNTEFDLSPAMRVKLLNVQIIDLIVSIHANADGLVGRWQNKVWGPRIIIGNNASRDSKKYAKVFASEFSDIPSSAPILLSRPPKWIDILEKTQAPAVLIECGFMDHREDLARLYDTQEEIATRIEIAIERISEGAA